ncbi:transporter substrate-binding domain-containing protein [Arthrobacter bambusae]|uniref:transporter substrate-binding domain-containing protein n=1 Tax=Arthrobacter bambusae TaxID=1338426 RepID=UPI001F50F08D|nr:transporter substrate-binding domain-containing protein [Arthrobacter bambusae]MCI0144089.1 transporter substrate-binding domain-containing protein [Arthrobacter bambusae]
MLRNNKTRAIGAGTAFALIATIIAGCSGGSASGGETPAAGNISLPGNVRDRGSLEVAAYLQYPPYRYTDADGKPAGIEVQMAEAVAKKLGLKINFHDMDFSAVIPAIQNGRFDFSLGAYADTPERQKVVDIMDYNVDEMGLIVAQGNPNKVSVDDFCGRTFGAVTGSQQISNFNDYVSSCAKAGKTAPTLTAFTDVGTEFQAIRNGRIDTLETTIAVGKYTEGQKGSGLVALPGAVSVHPTNPPVGWVFKKGDAGMERAVLQAIDELIKDGTWKTITDNAGITKTAVLPPTINTKALSLTGSTAK